MKTTNLLDRIKTAYGLPSDYATAKKIGITTQAVSKYRCKGATFDDMTAFKVAHLLDLNPANVIAWANFERATRQGDEKLIKFWAEQLDGVEKVTILHIRPKPEACATEVLKAVGCI